MVEMKPCPFCGRTRTRVKSSLRWGYFVGCNKCAAVGPSSSTPEGAIEKWNTRTGQSEVVRCRDCANCEVHLDGSHVCGLTHLDHHADYFCYFATSREVH